MQNRHVGTLRAELRPQTGVLVPHCRSKDRPLLGLLPLCADFLVDGVLVFAQGGD